jgi:hypothetical protein
MAEDEPSQKVKEIYMYIRDSAGIFLRGPGLVCAHSDLTSTLFFNEVHSPDQHMLLISPLVTFKGSG